MVRLTGSQRGLLADKLADLANLFAAGFVIGPFLNQGLISAWLTVLGVGTWVGLTALSVVITEETP